MSVENASVNSQMPNRSAQRSGRFLFLIFNPATALVMSILGYYSIAPLSNRFLSEGAIGSTLISAFVAAYIIATFILHLNKIRLIRTKKILFGATFLIIYAFRLFIEIYVDGTQYPNGNNVVLLFFFVNTVLFVPLITQMSWQMQDKYVYVSLLIACLVFLIGLSLNLSVLQETATSRMSLEKINPISMAHTAISLIAGLIIYLSSSYRSKIFTILLCPILLVVVVYARTRSAYIAPVLMGLFYILSQRGQRKIFLLILGSILIAISLSIISPEVRDVVASRLLYAFNENDQSTGVRLIMLSASWDLFAENIIFGKTILDPIENFAPHNFILEALIGTGIVGTSFLIVHISLTFWASYNILRATTYPRYVEWIVVLFIQYAFTYLVSGAVWGASPLMVCSFLILFVYYGRVPVSNK